MPQENVELVRSIYRAGGRSRFFDLMDEQIEVDASAYSPVPDYPHVIRGKAVVIDFYRQYWGTWEDYVVKPTAFTDLGEGRVLVDLHEQGRGKGSGARVERHSTLLFTLRAGQLTRLQAFENREAALEAEPPG